MPSNPDAGKTEALLNMKSMLCRAGFKDKQISKIQLIAKHKMEPEQYSNPAESAKKRIVKALAILSLTMFPLSARSQCLDSASSMDGDIDQTSLQNYRKEFCNCSISLKRDSIDRAISNLLFNGVPWPDQKRYDMLKSIIFPDMKALKGKKIPKILEKRLVQNQFVNQMDTACILDYDGFLVWEYRFMKDNKHTVFILGFDIDSSKIKVPYISIGDDRGMVQRLISPSIVCDSTDIFFYPEAFTLDQLKINYDRQNRVNRISVSYPID